jgi:hypothetical protein
MASFSKCVSTAAKFSAKDVTELEKEIAKIGGSGNAAAVKAAQAIMARAQTMYDAIQEQVAQPTEKRTDDDQREGNGSGRQEGRDLAPLAGAPSVKGFNGPDPRLVEVAERYARENGIDLKRQSHYAGVDPERAARIAKAYDEMKHDPQDPRVKAAYADLIDQTIDQYRALEKAGYKFWFMDLSQPDNQEYASTPWNAMRDIRANKEMGVFATSDGFGTREEFDPNGNPLLADTGFEWPVGGPNSTRMAPVLANDLFRAVHDAFGHGLEGAGFRAQGEENAWQAHARLFTGPALGAITTETRGQNSWLNYGPYGESNRTAKVEDTVFGDQKTGLMPEWTWTEGRVGDLAESAKRKQLDPEIRQALGAHIRNLTEAERAKLRRDTARKLVETIGSLPDAKEMAAVAWAGRAKRGWYANSARAIEHVFGADGPRFAALLAAMSPQCSVETNLFNTLSTWKNWVAAGRPTDREAIIDVMAISVQGNKGRDSVLDAWINNSVRALGSDDPSSLTLSGPKVNSFMLNLRGYVDEVTNDAWMANYALVNQTIFSGSLTKGGDPGKGTGYLAMSAQVRAAAKVLTRLTGETWTPAEVQETIWSWAKTIYEKADSAAESRSAVQLVQDRAVTDDLIRSTPDFRTLFHDDINEKLLREAGLGDRVDSLRGRSDLGDAGQEEQGPGRQAGPFADDAQRRFETRAARRLDKLRVTGKDGIARSDKRDEAGPGFYSALSRNLNDKVATKAAPAAGWRDAIKGLVNKGLVKQDEVNWSGVNEWLDLQSGKVTKDQVLDYLKSGGVRVEEHVLGGPRGLPDILNKHFENSSRPQPTTTEGWLDEAARQERIAQQWQKQGDQDRADRAFAIAEAMTEHAEQGETGAKGTKYSGYTLPGGENYREVLLTLPRTAQDAKTYAVGYNENSVTPFDTRAEAEHYRDTVLRGAQVFERDRGGDARSYNSSTNYQSNHWDQPNVLAHLRVNDRADADGKKVLFVEEIQSDWGQAGAKKTGRKNPDGTDERVGFAGDDGVKPVTRNEFESYVDKLHRDYYDHLVEMGVDRRDAGRRAFDMLRPQMAEELGRSDEYERMRAGRDLEQFGDSSNRPPAAPFVTKTEAWLGLALKRAIKMAVDGGYDKVAFTTGEQNVDRYDLSKQVDEIHVMREGDKFDLGFKVDGSYSNNLTQKGKTAAELEDIVGKEMAQRIAQQPEGRSYMRGDQLKAGGEGMKSFYDKIVPTVAKDVVKKLGGDGLTTVRLDTDNPVIQVDEELWAPRDNPDLTYRSEEAAQAAAARLASQPGFEITDKMRAQAADGLPLFSRKRIFDDSGRDYTAAQRQLFANTGRQVETLSLKERLQGLAHDWQKKMAQGLVDQFAPIKDLGAKGRAAYALARLSKGAAGAFEAVLHHGKLSINADGSYNADTSGGAMERVFMPLGRESGDFLQWMAGNRAEVLKAQGRENLYSDEDIAAAKSLADGRTNFDYTLRNGQVTRDRTLIYRDAKLNFSEFQKNVLDMAEQSGLIKGGADRAAWENEFYVPFYRMSEAGEFAAPNLGNALVRKAAFQKLKGGTEKLNADLLANTLQNWAHLIDASAKNRAGVAAIDAAVAMDVAYPVPASVEQGGVKGSVWVMENGEKKHYAVEDPYTLKAITALANAGFKGPIMDALSSMKHWLTIGVTSSPGFKIRNLIRDSVAAVSVSPLSANLLQNLKDGYGSVHSKDADYVSALAGGGLIRFNDMLESRQADRVRQLIRMSGDENMLDSDSKTEKVMLKMEKALMAYNELGNISEEINRAALYKQLIAKGFTPAEANLAARDLLDFSMQGSWATVRFLTQIVPFMNARLQGLYKLGRGAKEDPARFAAVLGSVALASVALMAAYHDDDDWKKREDWDRDGFWWFKFMGKAVRIPKPFEIGSIATLGERGIEFAFNPEMTGHRYGQIVRDLLLDNLSMNPIPQAVKPILDVYANTDSFTGRPIENLAQQKVDPDQRYAASTSMIARGASTAGNAVTGAVGVKFLSPVQIDHLLQGYFGWLGAFTVGAADMALRPITGQPSRPSADLFKVATQGMVADPSSASSYYVTSLYDQAKIMDQAYATYHLLVKEGKTAEAAEYLQDHRAEIAGHKAVDKVKAGEAKYGEMIRLIERSDMSPEEKRAGIDRIREAQDRLARVLTAAH